MELLGSASIRLAAYGSLRPGRENFHLVADLRGTWLRGHVRGFLEPGGGEGSARWPRLTADESGPEVEVDVLESEDLPARWEELDRFEGAAYRRELVLVELAGGQLVVANVFAKAG
jgi:gamma-glutamylcyclotransferase (GGCT)/AIG2-like uncharacterized protein YtfP